MYGTGYLTIKTVRKKNQNLSEIIYILYPISYLISYCFLISNSRDNQLHQVLRVQQDVLSVSNQEDKAR